MRKVLMGIMAAAVLLFGMVVPAGATAQVVTHPTCEGWVNTALASKMDPADPGYIMLDPDMSVAVVDFCVIFGEKADAELAKPAPDQDMYTALSTPVVHTFVWYDGKTYSDTAETFGYQGYIDGWHAEGLM